MEMAELPRHYRNRPVDLHHDTEAHTTQKQFSRFKNVPSTSKGERMKTNTAIRGIAAIIILSFIVGACGPGTVSKGGVPDWFLNPPQSKDKIYGTGASEKTASIQLGKDVAVGNARNALAGKIQISVQSMLRTFLQQSGTMEESRALQFSESVGKQVVNVTLSGVDVSKVEVKDGRVYALVEISMDSIKKAIGTSSRDAAAEYSELKAKSALEDLDKAINQMNAE